MILNHTHADMLTGLPRERLLAGAAVSSGRSIGDFDVRHMYVYLCGVDFAPLSVDDWHVLYVHTYQHPIPYLH